MKKASFPPFYPKAKRFLDLCGAGALLVATAPLAIGVGLGVRFSLGAPVLFRQSRPGQHGRPFTLLKFRTMRPPSPGEDMLATDAERLSAFGRFLRRSSLDEIPTLLNVIKGDMSLVGPRPLLMEYLPRYSPEQARRHEVKPGVTGWLQVNGRNALSWEEKFALDVWYVDHASLRLDLEILLRTFGTVLLKRGITHSGHATMPAFMGTPSHREGEE